jgi:hypothetical protein
MFKVSKFRTWDKFKRQLFSRNGGDATIEDEIEGATIDGVSEVGVSEVLKFPERADEDSEVEGGRGIGMEEGGGGMRVGGVKEVEESELGSRRNSVNSMADTVASMRRASHITMDGLDLDLCDPELPMAVKVETLLHSKNVEIAFLTGELTTALKKFDDLTATDHNWQARLDEAADMMEIAFIDRDAAALVKEKAELLMGVMEKEKEAAIIGQESLILEHDAERIRQLNTMSTRWDRGFFGFRFTFWISFHFLGKNRSFWSMMLSASGKLNALSTR